MGVDVELPRHTERGHDAVDGADPRREQQRPRNRTDEWRDKDRDLCNLLERASTERVRAYEDPGEQRPKHGRDQRGAAAHDDRVEERDPIDAFGEDLGNVLAGE